MEFTSISQHEQALKLRALRNQVLTSNIANADTPGYKARDIDFASALSKAKTDSLQLVGTSNLHMNSGGSLSTAASADMNYRIPTQPTLDGNTVETDVEQAQFAENALYYRASLAFLDGSIRTLKFAIKGGD
ncbi:MAG: flagellar basal body rod protein FlgB [Woeseiaceae bacterium]|nr:flagellar basal body rod protein FlgB [Woeseiaceae bacterium]